MLLVFMLNKEFKLVDVSDVTIVTSSVAVAGACCALYESDVTAFHHFLVDCRLCFTTMDIYESMMNVDARSYLVF